MRFVKSLLMLLMLVTFSTGFGKSTTDLKQNSKTEIVAFDIVKDVTFYTVEVETKIVTGLISTNALSSESYCVTFNAIVTDVGWRNSNKQHKQLANKENVMSLKDLYHKNKNKLKTNRICQSSQFSNSLTFLIYRNF
jgi:hypothetical protein